LADKEEIINDEETEEGTENNEDKLTNEGETVIIYDLNDGSILEHRYDSQKVNLNALQNYETDENVLIFEGKIDAVFKKVDLETLELVDYIPEKPEDIESTSEKLDRLEAELNALLGEE